MNQLILAFGGMPFHGSHVGHIHGKDPIGAWGFLIFVPYFIFIGYILWKDRK